MESILDVPLVYQLPIWMVFLMFMLVLLGSLEFGYRIGVAKKHAPESESSGGKLVQTALFALLGLILAFTYAAGVDRFEKRKQALIDEANALGTAFLRADLVRDPWRTKLKTALYGYARTRIVENAGEMPRNREARQALIEKTLERQAKIWPATAVAIANSDRGPLEASLVAAINTVIDIHTTRFAALIDTLPFIALWLPALIAAAGLAVAGYAAGRSVKLGRTRLTFLAAILSAVLTVIIDLDRPVEGFIQVNNYSIRAVILEMEEDLGM